MSDDRLVTVTAWLSQWKTLQQMLSEQEYSTKFSLLTLPATLPEIKQLDAISKQVDITIDEEEKEASKPL